MPDKNFQTAPCGNGRTKRTKRTKRGLIATPVNATLGVDLMLPLPLGTILSPLSPFLSAGYGQKIILGSGIGAARSTRPTSERIIPRSRVKGAEQFLYALRRRHGAVVPAVRLNVLAAHQNAIRSPHATRGTWVGNLDKAGGDGLAEAVGQRLPRVETKSGDNLVIRQLDGVDRVECIIPSILLLGLHPLFSDAACPSRNCCFPIETHPHRSTLCGPPSCRAEQSLSWRRRRSGGPGGIRRRFTIRHLKFVALDRAILPIAVRNLDCPPSG